MVPNEGRRTGRDSGCQIAGGTQTHVTETPNPADETPAQARDYIKALVLIALILGLVFLLFWIGIGGFCGCGTRPAG